MKNLFLILALLTFTTRCATTALPGEQADLLITGGTVLTMSGENIDPGSVVIRGDRIVEVGLSSAVDSKYSARERIDARGMAVLPGLVNSHTHAAMALFRGIADDRDLMDWLQNFIFPAEKNHVDAEFVRWGTRLALAEMIRSGTTTFADMYYFESDVARETKAAGIRAVLGETLIDFPAPDNKTWSEATAYIRGFVQEFRGDPLITAALAPHAPYTVSREHLLEVRQLATELGAPILIHVAETKSEVEQVSKQPHGLRPVEYLDSIGFLGSDVVAAHAIWLTPAEIEMFAKHSVGVGHCPESNMMLASGIAPIPALLKARVDVGLGTDGPAGSNNNLDMFEEMASAARLQKIMRADPKALSAREVLAMATIGGARALNLDAKIGTLEAGKQADVIVVDLRNAKTQPIYSVESALVYAASGSDVVTTVVAGKILMRDRRLLTLDEKAIVKKADEYRMKIQSSLAPR